MKPVRPVPARHHHVPIEPERTGSVRTLRPYVSADEAPGVGLYLLRAISDDPSASGGVIVRLRK